MENVLIVVSEIEINNDVFYAKWKLDEYDYLIPEHRLIITVYVLDVWPKKYQRKYHNREIAETIERRLYENQNGRMVRRTLV